MPPDDKAILENALRTAKEAIRERNWRIKTLRCAVAFLCIAILVLTTLLILYDRGSSNQISAIPVNSAGGICVVISKPELERRNSNQAVRTQTDDAGTSRRRRWLLSGRNAALVSGGN